MPDLITIGETMVAFIPEDGARLSKGACLGMRIAGAESNTAIALARLGHSAAWISRLGRDAFGSFVLRSIESEGVDTSQVRIDFAHPTGIMFKDINPGSETIVQYYRSHSAASFLLPTDLDAAFFKVAGILHITGITPVLSESCHETIRRAIALARDEGLLISFDPNIRKKLWKDKDYTPRLLELLALSDIVLTGLSEAETLFQTREIHTVADRIFNYPQVKYVAVKNGEKGALVASRSERIHIEPIPCHSIDPVGAGDGFNAGFLHGILEGKDLRSCGLYGGIIGALATETTGDIEGYPTLERLNSLARLYT